MDISLIIFIVVVVFFVYRGYRHGFLKSLSRILSLVAGYLAAILFARPVSAMIETLYPLPGIAALIMASIVLFIGAGIAVSLVFWLVKKFMLKKEASSAMSSIGGVTIGLVMGLLVAIVVVWSFAFVRDMGAEDKTASIKNTGNNAIENMAGHAIGTAVKTVMSRSDAQPEVINLSGAIIESPADIAKTVQRLSASNDLQALLQDPQNQAVLDSGDTTALQQLPAFQQLVNNPDLMALVKSAGLVDKSADHSKAAEVVLASKMSDIWQRMEKVKNNQRVQEILNDPEFQEKIQSGNPVTLLTNTHLLELADILFSDSAKPNQAELKGSRNTAQKAPNDETTIHQWVDKNGRIHFSDEQQKP